MTPPIVQFPNELYQPTFNQGTYRMNLQPLPYILLKFPFKNTTPLYIRYCPIKVCKPLFFLSLYLKTFKRRNNGTYTFANFGNSFELHK